VAATHGLAGAAGAKLWGEADSYYWTKMQTSPQAPVECTRGARCDDLVHMGGCRCERRYFAAGLALGSVALVRVQWTWSVAFA